MPFMMNCNNKGCGKHQTPALDLKDNDVYCAECGKTIVGVSIFMKNLMKSLGQVRKPPRPAYSVRCDKCKQEALPKLDTTGKLICSWCNHLHTNISGPFAILIKKAIAEGDKDI